MIVIPAQYAYLSLSLAVFAVWCVLFYLNRRGRAHQLFVSSVFTVAGPIGELLYIPDYWHPATVLSVDIFHSYVSIEDLIFAFSIMGIMSALPPLVLRMEERVSSGISRYALLRMAGVVGIMSGISVLLWFAGLNSIFATSAAMLAVAVGVLLYERERTLVLVSLAGALGMTTIMFVTYWIGFAVVAQSEEILRATWALYGTPLGRRVLGVPLAELCWAFSFGSLFSILFFKYRAWALTTEAVSLPQSLRKT